MMTSDVTRRAAVLGALAAALAAPLPARAEDMLPMDAGKPQIERAFGDDPGLMAPESFDLPPGVRPAPVGPGQLAPVPVRGAARTVGVPGIQFETGSARLTDASQSIVDMIGDALARRSWGVIVVGHTDASGDPDLNLELSKKRALTVAYYLVNLRGLPSSRVTYAGVGAAQPADGADPYAPINRRVTFVLQR